MKISFIEYIMKQLLLAIVLMGIMMQEIQMKVKECIMMVKLIGYVKDVILRAKHVLDPILINALHVTLL